MKNVLLLTLVIFTMNAGAQTLMESATRKFNNGDWAEAAKDYKKVIKKNDADSSIWYNYGVSLRNVGKYDEALESFLKARSLNFSFNFVEFSIAKTHALMDNREQVLAALEKAADGGLLTFTLLQTDTAFADYQQDSRFQDILGKIETNAYPCLTNPINRHFDFWIGEWDVFVNGNKVGHNSITRAKGGCAIHENYTTAGNYAGQSINFFSPVDELWHQHWVGSAGDVYNYVETKRDEGLLQFVSEFKNQQGAITLSRLTFTLNDDGTVRQLFENSSDDGKTWTPGFDGLYSKAE